MASIKPTKQRGRFYVRASFGSGASQRRISATLTSTTRKIADDAAEWEAGERALWEAEQLAELDDDDPAEPTLSLVWGELITASAAAWSPSHHDRMKTIRHDVDVRDIGEGRVLGEIPVAEISRLDVSAYLNSYAGSTIRGGVQPTRRSIMARLKAIRTALNYAIDTGRLAGDPTRKLKPPKGRFQEERDLPDLVELEATLRAACARLPSSKRYLDRGDRAVLLPALVTVGLWSGMRREEILGLRFRDVTFLEDGWSILKVRRAVTTAPAGQGGYRIGETKNDRHRELPLAPAATKVIGARRLALEAELAANDVQGVDVADAFVFSASFGAHPLRPASVRSWWDALRAVEPELDRVTFKDLRSTHNRKVKRALGDRGLAAAHMGHGEDVNREHYDRRELGDLDRVRDAIDGLLD